MQPVHKPVLLQEVIKYLDPKPNQTFVDGTVGLGGHAGAIALKIGPLGRIIGLDKDNASVLVAKDRLYGLCTQVILINDSYKNMQEHAYDNGIHKVDGVLLDLGFSSAQIDDPGRGFSFQTEGPLDMRYDRRSPLTAEEIVNNWNFDKLAEIFRKYGEEKKARLIANEIIKARKKSDIKTTLQLAEIIAGAVGGRHARIHPATKVFQALRIAVNSELEDLRDALPKMVEMLNPGGKIAIITFHSLEDKIVKNFFKTQQEEKKLIIKTKKPVGPTREEILENPRSRSAKLRVAEAI